MLFHKFYTILKHYFNGSPHQIAVEKIRNWYDGLHNWYVSSADNIWVENKVDSILYGEIAYKGMKMLASKLRLTSEDVFYDLGCGIGRFVVYMYLTTPIKRSVGIEMVGSRYKLAELVAKIMEAEEALDPRRKLTFIHNNIRNEDFSDATVIFMSSLCFPPELLEHLNQKFLKLKKGLRIITSSSLPEHPSLKLKEVISLPMTWTDSSRTYCYELI